MKIISAKDLNDNHEFYQKIELDELISAKEIIEDVKNNGDEALISYSNKFKDGNFKNSNDFLVSQQEIDEAFKIVPENIQEGIKKCIENVKKFAKAQFDCLKPLDLEYNNSQLGHKIVPLDRVLCYVPSGNYPLLSSAIMTCTPAVVAGVKEIIVASPRISPVTIVSAVLSGATSIYKIGGAQAISAFAYGTQSIKPVDKIVGPGNKYVTYAKKYVYGQCSIDFIAGPSEVLVVADDSACPNKISADILAQCEHDLDARGYLICKSEEFAKKVIECARVHLETLKTADTAKISFEKSYAVVVDDIEDAIEISNKRAPEHLELIFEDCEKYVDKFIHYGSLFIGENCAEVFGDYCSGTNHVLPTNKCAKYTGGLSVMDFVKIQTYQKISKEYSMELSKLASMIAEQEGLFAHKLSSDLRRK